MMAILSKFTVLYIFSTFVINFLKLKLILFNNRIIITIFLILLLHPIYTHTHTHIYIYIYIDVDPKLVARKEKYGTRVRGKKDILTKVTKDSVQYW